MIAQARAKWVDLWQRLGRPAPAGAFEELLAHYAEPQRAYHNLTHILDCLSEFAAAKPLAKDTEAVELAIWYHDAIYDSHSKDNEQRSADLAAAVMQRAGLSETLQQSVSALILATKSHDAGLHPDAPVMVDVDLSILGQPAARFDEYEKQIRKEYDWVTDKDFATGRAAVLKSFMGRATIYSTAPFRDEYEQAARGNLQRSLDRL